MPTYDYECQACGYRFDELQSFSAPPLTKCPKCKKNKLERLFGGGGAIIFKGGGFYETDYRRAGEKAPSDSAPAETSASETKTEAKADPAPAATPSTNGTAKPAKGASNSGGKKAT